MGQRLNIEIIDNGKRLANAYYHWSAYTSSAAALTNTVVDAYYELKDSIASPVEMAVRILEATGAGVNDRELGIIKSDRAQAIKSGYANLDFKTSNDRNRGLLSVTEDGMNSTEDWEEGRVSINIGSELIVFSVLWEDTPKDYEENWEEPFDNLTEVDYDFSCISFNDAPWLIEMCETYPRGFRTPDGFAITWME